MEQKQKTEQIQEAEEQKELQEEVSEYGRERGAIVLEVLAGSMQVEEASKRLNIQPPAYYSLEQRAIIGLIKACEPGTKGPGENKDKKIRELEQEIVHLEREVRRYQSLTRAAQKAIGLQLSVEKAAKPAPKAEKGNGRKKKAKPRKARGLRAAERLRKPTVQCLKIAE
jgi:hypothetical protein